MSRLRSNLSRLLLPALLTSPVAAQAADLGPILLTSPAGQPLQGLVSLSLSADETLDDLGVAVGSPAEYGWLEIGRPPWVDDVDVHVTTEDGEPRVRIWTADAPPERTFSLLLVVASPNGRSLRQYDIVLRDAEVLLAPTEPESPPARELAVERPGVVGNEAVAAVVESSPAGKASRRALEVPERGEPQVRRNLSISSAGTRTSDAALERRAQRLEETSAAQQRALLEANNRISELQGQVEKLEKLLAMKGVTPATPPTVAAGEAQKAAPAIPAEPPASATEPPTGGAPATEADAASEPANKPAEQPPAEGDPSTPAAEQAEHEGSGLIGQMATVGGALAAILLAVFWWRRRRARRAELVAAMAAAASVAPEGAAAELSGVPAEQAAPADTVAEAPAATEAAAIGAVDRSIAAALDAPMGDAAMGGAPAPAGVQVVTLDAVTAEPEGAAAVDELDTMFSEEAIAAAQAAIQTAATNNPAPVAEAPAAEPAMVPAPAADAAAPVASTPPDTEIEEADDPADLEDVEVNLAKAYIDMGDPDGARAILESMMADADNPSRAALARRTMRRFGLQPSAPPAEGAAPEA